MNSAFLLYYSINVFLFTVSASADNTLITKSSETQNVTTLNSTSSSEPQLLPCDDVPSQPSSDTDRTNLPKGPSDGTPSNPCAVTLCAPGYTCVVKKTVPCFGYGCPLSAACVNPCDRVRCPGNTTCISDGSKCGNDPFCEPQAICKNVCQGITCQKNQTCTAVQLTCKTPPCPVVPLCGENPCKRLHCPINQECYLKLACKGDVCEIVGYCANACESVKCPQSQYCYLEDRACVDNVCYPPVPVCKEPCSWIKCPKKTRCFVNYKTVCPLANGVCPPDVSCRPVM